MWFQVAYPLYYKASIAPKAPNASRPTQSIPSLAATPVAGLADPVGAGAVVDPLAITTLVDNVPEAPALPVTAVPDAVVVAELESLPLDTLALLEATLVEAERETDDELEALAVEDDEADVAADVSNTVRYPCIDILIVTPALLHALEKALMAICCEEPQLLVK